MIIRMRPYAGEDDKARMADLARAFPAGNIHVVDLPYRLASWALDAPANVGLWEDSTGRLLAWAVLQAPFWMFDYAYHPEAQDYGIHPQILTWAGRRAHALAGSPAGRPAWYVAVGAEQTERIGDLERHGFADQSSAPENLWSQVCLIRPTARPLPAAPLPPGFAVRALAGESEVAACVELHRAAFGTENMTAEWRMRTLRAPEYRADLDLVVVAPGGRLAAFCLGWLVPPGSTASLRGQIEPLGVHPAFRRLGLGGTVLMECLRRVAAHGASEVLVETDAYRDAAYALYESAGFQLAQVIRVYRRGFPESLRE